MLNSVLFFVFGTLICLLVMPIVIRAATYGLLAMDKPDDFRKKHDRNISRLGGIALMAAFTAAICTVLHIGTPKANEWHAILICSALMFALGLWDDFRPIGAKAKLAGQVLIAVIAFQMGLSIDALTHPTGQFSISLGAWSIILTVIWLISIPNIINLVDGVDGLAGGLGMFLYLTLSVIGLLSHQMAVAWISFAMAGALLGFLFFNLPPAQIFLGDGGAYLVGFGIAAISLQSSNKGSVAAGLLIIIVALGLPILDAIFALLRRAFRGYPLFRPDNEHIHHRFQKLGFSRKKALLILYAVCVFLSLIGLSLFWRQGRSLPIVLGAVFTLSLVAVRFLGYVPHWGDFRVQAEHSLARRRDVQFAVVQGQVAEMEVERCRTADEFWPVFFEILQRTGFHRTPPPGPRDTWELRLEFRSLEPLIVYAITEGNSHDYWHRLAECFRPAYRKARKKWPAPELEPAASRN
jgi:UDP-GlcNAc:undecaprenyl-phosphate/decaprenyl-phosphate GlcNAc-1-phosphate transferase